MDEQNDKKLAELLDKFQAGTCTPEEQRVLDEAFLRMGLHDRTNLSDEDFQRLKAIAWQPIVDKAIRRPRVKRLAWVPYAAAILIAATAVTWILFGDQIVNRQSEIVNVEDIAPGTNRATLTLADGRTIDLSEAQTGIVVGDERITYDDSTSVVMLTAREASPTPQTLVLTTPKGGTYQITLPDGSKVWLNAASTLKYPSHFTGNGRTVELTGEAYFEVAKAEKQKSKNAQKQAWPFWVVSKGQRVEVLGTQFNISAYPDELITKTTLVEGAVRLQAGATGASVSLVPGEQGQLIDGTIQTRQVNTLKYTSWKDGLFYFRDAGIDEVVNQLERWYDVEVVYAGDKPTNQFTGEIPRNRHASEVLAMLQYFGVQYRINGKTITLSNNQF